MMGVSLRVQARSNRFDETDSTWLAQAGELPDALEGRGVPVSRERTTESGHKGAVTTIVLGIASAGGLAACVEAFKAWLARDRSRWIELSHMVDGVEKESFALRGRGISEGQFDQFVEELKSQLNPPE